MSVEERLGRLAYVRSSIGAIKAARRTMKIKVDGRVWFEGKASCVLFGNVGTITGGLKVFPDARPDDGLLEIGVVTARSAAEWLRVLSRVIRHNPDQSPMVRMTRGRTATVRLDRSARYELDGGPRTKADKLEVHIDPGVLWVCVPGATD
jgi:diacylglycerol kinase family enzyme